jgi:hypothetical protein
MCRAFGPAIPVAPIPIDPENGSMAISPPKMMKSATVGDTDGESRTVTIDVDGSLTVRAMGPAVISGAVTHRFDAPTGGVHVFRVKKGDQVTFKALAKTINGTEVAWDVTEVSTTIGKCRVPGCGGDAELEVLLYDFYPHEGTAFMEQDHTCPFICRAHARENERNARGERKPRGEVTYPFTNQQGAQGFTIYRELEDEEEGT